MVRPKKKKREQKTVFQSNLVSQLVTGDEEGPSFIFVVIVIVVVLLSFNFTFPLLWFSEVKVI